MAIDVPGSHEPPRSATTLWADSVANQVNYLSAHPPGRVWSGVLSQSYNDSAMAPVNGGSFKPPETLPRVWLVMVNLAVAQSTGGMPKTGYLQLAINGATYAIEGVWVGGPGALLWVTTASVAITSAQLSSQAIRNDGGRIFYLDGGPV